MNLNYIMKWISSFVRDADILGFEINLLTNQGSKKSKNLFGGLISILTMILIICGTSFFSYEFFSRNKLTLISNIDEDPSVSINNFNEVPFMLRLSGDGSARFPSNYYNVYMLTSTFEESKGSEQTFLDIQLEPCDLKIHFKNKYHLLKDIKEVDSYYCPKWENKFDLFGIYGSKKFTYIFIAFSPCVGSTLCADRDLIYRSLSSSYLDYITLSNEIDHNSQTPNKEKINKDRIAVSSSIFKRIWIFYETVKYTTDFGYIFEENNIIEFKNVKKNQVDVDLRNVIDTEFLWVTLHNHPDVMKFSRGYMKAQSLLANVGGIINGLIMCGTILCYSISNNLMNQDLANSIYQKSSSFDILEDRTSLTNGSVCKQQDLGLLKKTRTLISIKKRQVSSEKPKNTEDDSKKVFTEDAVKTDEFNNNSSNNVNLIKKKNNKYNKNEESEVESRFNTRSMKPRSTISLLKANNFLRSNLVNYYKNKRSYQNENENNNVNIDNKELPNNINEYKNYNEVNDNFTKVKFFKNEFKFSFLNLLDPCQFFLNKSKKIIYEERMTRLKNYMRIDVLLSTIQEYNLTKNLLLNEDQVKVLENLYKAEPNTLSLSKSFNALQGEKSIAVNTKLIKFILE